MPDKPPSSHLFILQKWQSTVRKHRRTLYKLLNKVSSCHKVQSLDMVSASKALISCGEQAERARTRLSGSAAQSCCICEGQGRTGRAASWERRMHLRKPHQLFLHNYFHVLNSEKNPNDNPATKLSKTKQHFKIPRLLHWVNSQQRPVQIKLQVIKARTTLGSSQRQISFLSKIAGYKLTKKYYQED